MANPDESKNDPSSSRELPLPSLPGLDGVASDADRELGVTDLLETISAVRRTVDRLRPCTPESCADLLAHERVLRILTAQLREKTGSNGGGVVHTAFEAARNHADVLEFEVPPSHRKQVGGAVTAAKRAFVKGLKPFHVEMLRQQKAFNVELLNVLELVTRVRGADQTADLGPWVRQRLERLVDPNRYSPASHRQGGLGSAVMLAKRSYLKAMGPVLRALLSGQTRWNAEAVNVLAQACRPIARPPEESNALVARLEALTDPLDNANLPVPLRASTPLWREVLRRQMAFNREVMLSLANMLEGRPQACIPPPPDYAGWLTQHEPQEVAAAAEALKGLKIRPLVSLVMPAYETPPAILRECLESVRAQQYDNWELCIVDDGSPSQIVRKMLAEYAERDPRIRWKRLERNSGIARATNAAIELARGEWIGFIDHDDSLTPHALSEIVLRLAHQPSIDWLYSDEDRLSLEGVREHPFFKPDWSPDLLRSVNYICHFVVARAALVREVEGLREGFEGAQDFDFLLRLSEKSQRVAHVPKVLYHWRNSPGSLSRDEEKLKAASSAGVRALQEHLARLGESATVDDPKPTQYRVRYAVQGKPLVSIIVPFKDKPELLERLCRTLFEKTRYDHFELILISNNSVRPETEALIQTLTDPRIRKLKWDHPFNYPAINNYGVTQAKGELLLFLNNDMEVTDPLWLDELIGQAQRPEVGSVGCKLLFPDGTIQHAGVIVGISGYAAHPFWRFPNTAHWTPFGHADWNRNYLALTSACLMMRRKVFEDLEGYDEHFQVCGSDVDLGLKVVRAGMRNLYTANTWLYHHESASRRNDAIPENDFWISFAKYRDFLRSGDPFYNPNLSLMATDLSLRQHDENAETLAQRTLATFIGTRETPSASRAQGQRHVMDHIMGLDHDEASAALSRAEATERMARLRAKGRIDRVDWLVPAFQHPFGGIHTILRFAEYFQRRHGVENTFVIYDNPHVTEPELESRIAALYPERPGRFRVLRRHDEIRALPPCDLVISTLWASAFFGLRHDKATVRGYFVQDYEPQFYPAGVYSALAEQTYRLGFYGIFNTPGLHESITRQYPMEGCWFEPSVDHEVFHNRRPTRSGPVRIFCYARPSTDRNGFELAMTTLRAIKQELGAAVEIIAAGEHWRTEDYGVAGVVRNLGVLPYEQTAALYREVDVGLCFMFTKHPSYLPLELMASGVAVVTNLNPANTWLLRHEENCLLAEPTYSAVLGQLRRVVSDHALRSKLGQAGAARMEQSTWDAQIETVYQNLCHGEGREAVIDAPQRHLPNLNEVAANGAKHGPHAARLGAAGKR